MTHQTTTRNGTEYPAPGKWSLNWVEGDVVSWRYGDDGDRIHDGPTAHAFVSFGGMGSVESVRVDVDGETVEVIDDPINRDAALRRIGDILADHEPDD
jgi:hypothetical protein